MTEEEKTEEKRRLKAIWAGLHPDTGKPLRPDDEKTLKATEKLAVRMQRYINKPLCGVPYPTAIDRVMRDFRERERQRIARYSKLNRDAAKIDRVRRRIDPLANNPLLRDQLQQVKHQKLLDAAMGGSAAGAMGEHMDVFERQRRYLDPLLDRDFVQRLTGRPDDDLMRRATALQESDAVRILREQVDRAAALRITDQWAVVDKARRADMIASANAFARDTSAMASEVQRMLSVYGPTLAEQTRFLSEYRANLGLFHTVGLTAVTFERANLLARIAMPATLAAGFDGYDPSNVEIVQAYGESVLRELEDDFGRDGNPVYAWEAFAVARRYEIDPPEWVEDFLADAADRIMEIRDEVADGKPIKREAQRVGKALGFGKDGPGQGGWFKHATMLQRDRTIYFEVSAKVRGGVKLDFAYDDVAKSLTVSRSTIVRAYLRITKLTEGPSDQVKGEGELS